MSDLEAEYRLDYFEEEGFERKECPSCGAHFWTRDADRELCGEPPCEDYSFIDDPGSRRLTHCPRCERRSSHSSRSMATSESTRIRSPRTAGATTYS